MELNEKLQELRKQKGLTQEELARALYVSRTAISKWESGRGYPSIDSLKAIAKFFSITVDELLSGEEVLVIAQEDQKKRESCFLDRVFGLLDLGMLMLLFLPFFAERTDGTVQGVSLLFLGEISPYLRVAYLIAVLGTVVWGILTLALLGERSFLRGRSKENVSLALGAVNALLFMLGLHPYAAVFSFSLLAIKGFLLIKRQ